MDYFLFVAICLAATFSPGPAVLLAIKNAISFGMKKTWVGIAGNISAMITMASFSAAGISLIILSSPWLFAAIKIVGGIYLIYLGVKSWRARQTVKGTEITPLQREATGRALFYEAYIVGMTNPKAIAFYTALFPQFIDLNQPVFAQFAELTLTFAACSFSALSLYALLGTKLKIWLTNLKNWRRFQRITGSIFIGYGVALLSSQRT